MDILYSYHNNLTRQLNNSFFRFLIDKIDWNQRMVAIKGPRGAGKTTLLLQYIQFILKRPIEEALYITADHYWFYTHNLVETAEEFYKSGGRYLFIDEVHKYPRWSRELKNIYDGFPELKIVFTSSSALEIFKGEADLSRRVITYELPGLSFREYLSLKGYKNLPVYKWDEIKNNHNQIAHEILQKFQPLPLFRKYLKHGYLPLFTEDSEENVTIKLNQIINTVIETDLGNIKNYSSGTAFKVKKLLGVLAESVPFKPNISALSRKLDVSRDSVYEWFSHLQNARLLNLINTEGKGVAMLQKPEKIYLENTNLAYALKIAPDIGSLRETFLLNQLTNANISTTLPKSGDFYANETVIEVGGKNKTAQQVKQIQNHIIASDDIETGYKNKIPLWLFGFLY
ncbi:MAG: ATP-binding protein [Bacteroidota bacterium]